MLQKDVLQQRWNELGELFAHKTDGLGMPIDEPIMETVLALNALDIPTTMSCGGHIVEGERFAIPWVDVEVQSSEHLELLKTAQQKFQEAEKLQEESAHLQKDPSAKEQAQILKELRNSKYVEMHKLRYQARLLQCPVRHKLIQYLEQFYRDRVTSFDCRLILSGRVSGRTRLSIQGGEDFYLDAPLEIQQQKLAEYREEMGAFTAFLKAAYFSAS
ncbi:hypothetical protein [Dictyobacter arantiisoli]|uniref:Uncharacterized protein n=1 Tax=Dictyobacter arantiisoli TaxID=2014874 RepID=A0A5A5TG64_9CHLR|nr:hypothetical protein [Dictyobacter arantiisoli]GCF10215.1 hypothetical protein KDI_37790 [Dictyobacter arantiisoli]